MRTRIAAAAVAVAALASLSATACSSSGGGKSASHTAGQHTSASAAPPSSPAVDRGTASPAPRPPAPTGAARKTYLAALKAIDPSLAGDPEKVIDKGRTQCTEINGDTQTADHLAAERFGRPGKPLTDAQGAAIDAALKLTVCRG